MLLRGGKHLCRLRGHAPPRASPAAPRRRAAARGCGGARAAAAARLPALSSPANERVKRLVRLRTSPKARREAGAALLVGADVVAEVASAPHALRSLLLREGAHGGAAASSLLSSAASASPSCACFVASAAVMDKVAGVGCADGVVAVAEVALKDGGAAAAPEEAAEWAASLGPRVLALDGVQDPGNVGTLLRTALALGWRGALLLGDSCDAYNEKCLRAGRGAAAKLPTRRVEAAATAAALEGLRQRGFAVVAAEPPRDATEAVCARAALKAYAGRERVCLVLGSEGQGLTDAALRACQGSVSVPQDPQSMESLNVGVAGGILMYALAGE